MITSESSLRSLEPPECERKHALAPRVLVFDSGVGGLTVLREIRAQMPWIDCMYLADNAGFPYGSWPEESLVERISELIGWAVEHWPLDAIVIACNTASTITLPFLRSRISLPVVGTVPAIKPAATASLTGMISLLATPGTIRREYTRDLIRQFASHCSVTLVGAKNLAQLAESVLFGRPVSLGAIDSEIEAAFVEDADGRRTDTVILGCTHYPLLMDAFQARAPWPVVWLDPADAIARRLSSVVGDFWDPQENSGWQRDRDAGCAIFTGELPTRLTARRLSVFGLSKVTRADGAPKICRIQQS